MMCSDIPPFSEVLIISIVYDEPYWAKEIKPLIESVPAPVLYVHRNKQGVGSLAEAINRNFYSCDYTIYKYVWIITNVKFNPDVMEYLLWGMKSGNYAAIHPAMPGSDHVSMRGNGTNTISDVPFVEFCAPMVRTDVLCQFNLDQDMPYWGHDMDWGYRVRQAGYQIGVHNGCEIEHKYIRHSLRGDRITRIRMRNRRLADESTRKKLISLYGKEYKTLLGYGK